MSDNITYSKKRAEILFNTKLREGYVLKKTNIIYIYNIYAMVHKYIKIVNMLLL